MIFLTPNPSPRWTKVERGDRPHPQPLSKVERGDSPSLEKGAVTVETGRPSELLRNARRLRKNQTDAEHLMWQALRNRSEGLRTPSEKLNNWKFRLQHPISEGFILDFYCAEKKVAVELDGAHHQLKDQNEYDENRSTYLKELGIRIIRILNEEALSSKENVLQKIIAFTNFPPPSHE